MNVKLVILIIASSVVAHYSSFATADEKIENWSTKESYVFAGATAGFGSAYGNGVEVGYSFKEKVDLNAGAGFNMSGRKIGVGGRVFMEGKNRVSPFFGISYVKSSGLNNVSVVVDGEGANYSLPSNRLLHLKVGARYVSKYDFNLIGGVGYGFALDDNDPIYNSGSTLGKVRDLAESIAAGGIEVSGSALFTF